MHLAFSDRKSMLPVPCEAGASHFSVRKVCHLTEILPENRTGSFWTGSREIPHDLEDVFEKENSSFETIFEVTPSAVIQPIARRLVNAELHA